MIGDDFDSETLYNTTIIEQIIRIDQIVSEPELKALKPKSRKCLFPSESNSKYFNVALVANVNSLSLANLVSISSGLHH